MMMSSIKHHQTHDLYYLLRLCIKNYILRLNGIVGSTLYFSDHEQQERFLTAEAEKRKEKKERERL